MNRIQSLFSALFAALLCAAPAWSCVNTFEPELLYALEQRDDAATEILQGLRKAHAEKATLENSNDLGVALLLSGKTDEAIALFRAIEKKFPGNARVAANLGSALELEGKYDEALEWIHESVIRDVTGFKGSEWLHERMLKARVALPDNPRWFDRDSVLGLDFGSDDVPVAPEILPFDKGKLKGGQDLLRQVDFQLQERTKSVKPPDPVIGDLFAAGGDLVIASGLSLLDGGTEDAKRYYTSALEYGAPHADRIRKRLARYESDLAALPARPQADEVDEYPGIPQKVESSRTLWIAVAAVALAGGIGAALLFWRRRKARQG